MAECCEHCINYKRAMAEMAERLAALTVAIDGRQVGRIVRDPHGYPSLVWPAGTFDGLADPTD